MPKVITFVNQKGGAGKTTSSLNLASAFAHNGFKTIVLDADPQGSLTKWAQMRDKFELGAIPNLTIQKWTKAPSEMPAYVKGLDCDIVVIDSPPRADEALSRAVVSASPEGLVIVPVRASALDIWAADETFTLIRAAQKKMPNLKFKVMLSAVKSRASITNEISDTIKAMQLPILSAGTHDRTAYSSAISSCQTIYEFAPASSLPIIEIEKLYQAIKKELAI